jgi:hypothetical protein
VHLTLAGNPAASGCGSLSSSNGVTGGSGFFNVTYTAFAPSAPNQAGFCTITAAEANSGAFGQVTIDQTNPTNPPGNSNNVSVTANPPNMNASTSGSTVTSQITVAVNDPFMQPVKDDPLNVTLSANNPGACGTISNTSGSSGSSGSTTFTYTASTVSGFCNITVQEAQTGSTGGVQIDQKTNPAPPNSPYTVTVVAVPNRIPADGKSQSTVTITVKDSSGAAVSGDPLQLSLTASVSDPFQGSSCGSLNASTGVTNASGQLVVTYTSSSRVGFCTVNAKEANTAQSGSTSPPIDQT